MLIIQEVISQFVGCRTSCFSHFGLMLAYEKCHNKQFKLFIEEKLIQMKKGTLIFLHFKPFIRDLRFAVNNFWNNEKEKKKQNRGNKAPLKQMVNKITRSRVGWIHPRWSHPSVLKLKPLLSYFTKQNLIPAQCFLFMFLSNLSIL